jgi:hypothetical protein
MLTRQPADIAPCIEPDIIRRASAIAPQCGSLAEVKRRLILEGYFQVNAHLSGRQIRRDLLRKLDRALVHSIPKRTWRFVEP